MSNQPFAEDSQRRQERMPQEFVIDIGIRSYTHPHHQQSNSPHSYSRTQLDPSLLLHDISHKQPYTHPNLSIPSNHGANYGLPGSSTLGDSAFSGLGSPQNKQTPFLSISPIHEIQRHNWSSYQSSQIYSHSWAHSIPDSLSFGDNVQDVTAHPRLYPPTSSAGNRPSVSFNGLTAEHPQHKRNLSLDEGISSSKEYNLHVPGGYRTATNPIRNSPWSAESRFDAISGSSNAPPEAKMRTTQACERCRARKAKCSGERPSCARCVSRGISCEYANQRRMRGPNKPKLGKRTSLDKLTDSIPKSVNFKRDAASGSAPDVSRSASIKTEHHDSAYRGLGIFDQASFSKKGSKSVPSSYLINSGPHDGAESFPFMLPSDQVQDEDHSQGWIKMERRAAASLDGQIYDHAQPPSGPWAHQERNSLTIDTQNLGSRQPSSEFDAYSSLNSSCETSPAQSLFNQQVSDYRDKAGDISTLFPLTQNYRAFFGRQGEPGDIATPTSSSNSPVTPISGDELSSPESSASWAAEAGGIAKRERAQVQAEEPARA